MRKELANYKSSDGGAVIVVKRSPVTYKHRGVTAHSVRSDDVRVSLIKTIESVNQALRKSEEIIPVNRVLKISSK